MFPSMAARMGPRQQGDVGELSAMGWLVDRGWQVYLPLGHSPDVDMVALRDSEVARVQVKTSTQRVGRRYTVSICTRGGNRSWSGLVKRFTPDRCDYLFVHCSDGRRWFIPAAEVVATTSVQVGGPRYASYEVESGRPLPGLAPVEEDPRVA